MQFGLRGCGMRAYELRCHCEHLLRASELGLQEPVVILADLRDDPFAHLHGHPVDDAAGDEHAATNRINRIVPVIRSRPLGVCRCRAIRGKCNEFFRPCDEKPLRKSSRRVLPYPFVRTFSRSQSHWGISLQKKTITA